MPSQVKLEPKLEDEPGFQFDQLHDGLEAIRLRHPACVKGNCVYFVTDGKLTKIGTTGFMKPRLATIQTNNGQDVTLHHLYECLEAKACEDELHTLFNHQHARGEWYALSDAHLRLLKAVLKLRRFEVPVEDAVTLEQRALKRRRCTIAALARNFPELATNDLLAFLSARVSESSQVEILVPLRHALPSDARNKRKTPDEETKEDNGKIMSSESDSHWWDWWEDSDDVHYFEYEINEHGMQYRRYCDPPEELKSQGRFREGAIGIGECAFVKEDREVWTVKPRSLGDIIALLKCEQYGSYGHWFLYSVTNQPYGIFGHASTELQPDFNFWATAICKHMAKSDDLHPVYFHGPALLYIDPARDGTGQNVDWVLIQQHIKSQAPKVPQLPDCKPLNCPACHSTGITSDQWEGEPCFCPCLDYKSEVVEL